MRPRDFVDARNAMVDVQLRRRGIADKRVLDAMSQVGRELYVSSELAACAYDDRPLPIGSGQTISQPYMVALMLEAAEIGPDDHVLEVGTGSGYATALLARLARSVHTIERDAELFEAARRELGDRVRVHLEDGRRGLPEAAPYDAIVVTAAPRSVPPRLKQQLAFGGRMIVPVGGPAGQRLLKLTRDGRDEWETRDLGPVMFVPLV